jgi:hypothetical protein
MDAVPAEDGASPGDPALGVHELVERKQREPGDDLTPGWSGHGTRSTPSPPKNQSACTLSRPAACSPSGVNSYGYTLVLPALGRAWYATRARTRGPSPATGCAPLRSTFAAEGQRTGRGLAQTACAQVDGALAGPVGPMGEVGERLSDALDGQEVGEHDDRAARSPSTVRPRPVGAGAFSGLRPSGPGLPLRCRPKSRAERMRAGASG